MLNWLSFSDYNRFQKNKGQQLHFKTRITSYSFVFPVSRNTRVCVRVTIFGGRLAGSLAVIVEPLLQIFVLLL